ncbi:nitrate/nitrite transporter [Actinomyces sp. MRS3W]|uniref:nitrate/nitrite transporter n=1 Tax=Actinomyces sp. MRS3W TaxID=2800796 RepID=UPI0028FDB1F5|nr:MFS transporter [Actinomyces sp. MRS3W]MDU0347522.1 MFS transporter [Actinomyces sp. MRS3W]
MSQLDTTGRVLNGWNPEEPEHWSAPIAWRTLIITTFSLVIAFCVFFLVSAIAPRLKDIGFDLTASQLYWLTAMPGLSGGLIRLVYMFLPPIVGTRKLIGISSLLYLIPMLGWFVAVQNTSTPYAVLLLLSFLCGIGGGTFSGYMPSTGYFFPKRLSGTALNVQAGLGNLGMSIIQILGPWLMGFGLLGITFIAPQRTADNTELFVHNAAIFFVPWAILAAILAFWLLKDVPVKANFRQQIDIFSNPDTWLMTLLYVLTFGLFSGFSAQFGLLINNTFGPDSTLAASGYTDLPRGATYAFLGPLIGSLVRVAWGPLCDRISGAFWTFVSAVGMAVTLGWAALYLHPSDPSSFRPFLWVMLAMFFFAGIGNAGTFKQMPMIMPQRQAGGAIGFTAAVACFGPFFVGVALSAMDAATWFWICAVYSALCAVICWVRYARPGAPFPG